jgi:hypothetical protein
LHGRREQLIARGVVHVAQVSPPQHPELNMPSQVDIDQARAFAGLPPEIGNASFQEFTAPVPNSTPPKP